VNDSSFAAIPQELQDGQPIYVWVDYDGTTLTARLNRTGNRDDSGTVQVSRELDLVGILGDDEAFIGFTSGTGSEFANHDILRWQFSDEFDPIEEIDLEFQYVPVDFSAQANVGLADSQIIAAATFPVGNLVLGDVPFEIGETGPILWSPDRLGTGAHTLSIPVTIASPREVHTLINTYWGQPGPESFAHIEFFGSEGAYQRFDLVGNDDIRDYNDNPDYTNSINGTTTIEVFSNGSGQRLDKQFFALNSDFIDETLVEIRVTDNGAESLQRIFLYGLTVGGIVAPSASPQFIQNPENGNAYALSQNPLWETSQAIAAAFSGNLASIGDQDENDWVFENFSDFAGVDRSLWIGLTREAGADSFRWISGDPFTFEAWNSGEPNGDPAAEQFAHLIKPGLGAPAGTWNDSPSPNDFEDANPVTGLIELEPYRTGNGSRKPVTTDLWDVASGAIVTAHSPFDAADGRANPFDAANILGAELGAFFPESGEAIFDDESPQNFVDFIEWETAEAVEVRSFRLFAETDSPSNDRRGIASFRLLGKSPGSTTFDVVLFDFLPVTPYLYLDAENGLLLEANIPRFEGSAFRAEFTAANSAGWRGPRIVELDGFETPLQETPGAIVADSIADYSVVQGQDGWFYGYYDGPFEPADFTPMTESNGGWAVETGAFWTSLGRESGHPNGQSTSGGRQPADHWVTRRYVSEVEGQLSVTGEIADANIGNTSSGGTLLHIFIDGAEVESIRVTDDGTTIPFAFEVDAEAGTTIDFAVDPFQSDDLGDSFRFHAVITKVAESAEPKLVPDPNLETALREALGIPAAPLTQADLETLTRLDLSNRGITDLTGLECATNLRVLNLRGNNFADLNLTFQILDRLPLYCVYRDFARPSGNNPTNFDEYQVTGAGGETIYVLVDPANLDQLDVSDGVIDTTDPDNVAIIDIIEDSGITIVTGEQNLAPAAGGRATLDPSDPNFGAVLLDASASADVDGEIASVNWTWNGGSAAGISASAIFPLGQTDVTLSVTDDDGAATTTTITVNITVPEPGEVAIMTAIELEFGTQIGLAYQIEYTDDFSSWFPYWDEPMPGDGLTWSVLIPLESRGRTAEFYRIVASVQQ